MASYEVKPIGLCVIRSDGSFRNQMFSNRIRESLAKVETPSVFNSIPSKDIVEMVNEILTYHAYIECADYMTKFGMSRSYSRFIYFNCKEDAMAFKLRWS